MNALEVRDLCKDYPQFHLENVSFNLEYGSIMGFVGRNGAGKTTTLKCMYNLTKRKSGEILFDGVDILDCELEYKKAVGISLGQFEFYQNKKIKDIAKIMSSFYEDWDESLYKEYMQKFSLDGNKTSKELSNGMKVKFSLTLALSHGAKILIFDEPTSGLDPVSRDEILDIFEEIVSDGEHAVLFSTHVISDLEKCADSITYIKKGNINYTGSLKSFESKYLYYEFSDVIPQELQNHLIYYKERLNKVEGIGLSTEEINSDLVTLKRKASLEEIVIGIERGEENA